VTKKRQFCPRGHDAFQAGRDASKRCLQCKAEDAAAKVALQEQAIGEANAVYQRREDERERRLEQEYQAAIKRGGYDAAMARWDKAYLETNDAYGGRYGLCQWEDEVDGESIGRMCYRRTTGVYCHIHDRRLERKSEQKRKAKEGEQERGDRAHVERPKAPPRPRRPRAAPTSRWAEYKAKHPERAAFYASSTWRFMREQHLKSNPFCVVCGERASHADHVLAIANGGTTDGRLQSMCAKHHHEKTVRDSHEAAKRAAARRKEKQR
jgi:hypothetical protein